MTMKPARKRAGAGAAISRMALVLGLLATPLAAGPPETSPRPVARMQADAPAGAQPLAVASPGRYPGARPGTATAPAVAMAGHDIVAVSTAGIAHSLRPSLRPANIVTRAVAQRQTRARGAVCGDPALQGEAVGPVPGRGACGIDDAVRLRSVSGVALSQKALMDCRTAKALKTWVDRGLKPAVGARGGGVAQLRVAAHYSCRTRNNQAGAKISEHGKGRAIDISAVVLGDGSAISVLQGWGSRTHGKTLAAMRKVACGPFGTVLGPGSDRFHSDHFHFDTARHRSGSYCR